ncbi:hypothetical protein [Streptomyces meridianus]|uniref:Integral membrane protein n=1 Tax=Streptomyces meridianus TaxID=2938945 RepID=A0ABT0WZY2_9ACTN|nr:hypothetical protein [Streptomyces meridianus]MCM2575828.1 hypothetical protein [Streptomyces meridianus]
MTTLALSWFDRKIMLPGRLPLFVFLCSFIFAFAVIRFSVRMIRAQVRWWPGNVKPGGLHIHHMVFGMVFMLVSGVWLIAVREPSVEAEATLAGIFGVGAALVLDEFALILHLRDVYWEEAGRTSVDAVFVAVALVGLLLLGFRPIGVIDWSDYSRDPTVGNALLLVAYAVVELGLALVTLLKGKVWTGLVGLFVLPLLLVGAIRLSRPNAPWARWRYGNRPKRLARATRREEKWRTPVITAKIRVQEFLSGRHDLPDRRGR